MSISQAKFHYEANDMELIEVIFDQEIKLARLNQSLSFARIRRMAPFFTENYEDQIKEIEKSIAANKTLLNTILFR